MPPTTLQRRESPSSQLYPIVQDIPDDPLPKSICCTPRKAARRNSMSTTSQWSDSTTTTSRRRHSADTLTSSFHDTYVLTRPMFRSVWECVHRPSGQRYCVKRLPHASCTLLQDAQSHPSILRLVDCHVCHGKTLVVTELCTGGNLLTRVVQRGPLSEDHARAVARTLLEGLVHLTAVHGRIEPSHVLLDAHDHAVLAGFGKARKKSAYAAPEGVSDVYSVGAVVYFALFGKPPARSAYPTTPAVSRTAKQWISCLLLDDPAVRWTPQEALEHPWLATADKPRSIRSLARRLWCRKPQQYSWKSLGSNSDL